MVQKADERVVPAQQYCNVLPMTVRFLAQTFEPLEVGSITRRLTELSKTVAEVEVTIQGTIDIPPETRAELRLNNITIFVGTIATPVKHERGVTTFTILNQIESFEIGFSPEESQLGYVNQLTPWPLGFGTPKLQPTVIVRKQPSTTTRTNICLINGAVVRLRNQTLDALNQSLLILQYLRLGLETVYEPTAITVEFDYISFLNIENTLEAILDAARLEVEDQKGWWEDNQNNNQLRIDFKEAEEAFQVVARNVGNLLSLKNVILGNITKLEYRRQGKEYLSKQLIQEWNRARNLKANFYQLEKKICSQLLCSLPQQYVNGSEFFPQLQDVNVRINGLLFTVQFDGDSMLGIAGPLNEQIDLPLSPWAPDDEPCSEYVFYNGIDLLRTTANGLTNKWLLVTDVDGNKHILKCLNQVDEKVYVQLVPWSAERFELAQSQSIENIINDIVATPLSDVFRNGIPTGYYTDGLDPNLWRSPETARYLELIALVFNPTLEERRNIARLAYLERFDKLGSVAIHDPLPSEVFTVIAPNIVSIDAVCGRINPDWLASFTFVSEEVPKEENWEASPGTEVIMDTCEIHVVNILPSTIKAVYAYYTNNEGRGLRQVPTRYYEIDFPNLGSMTPTVLKFWQPMSENPGWENEIYTTYESSIGPVIPDIIAWLVETYTDKVIDQDAFLNVREAFTDKYPANFVFYDRPDAIDAINRICWEARCAATLQDNTVHLTYLAEEPAPFGVGLTTATILKNTRQLTTQSTESIITRYNVVWHKNGVDPEEDFILRNNLPVYKLKSEDVDFLIFDTYDLVHKTINFWLMRRSNLFYELTCDVTISGINYRLLEGMTTPYRVGRLLASVYNHTTRTVTLTAETPFRYQEVVEYPYYWPAAIDAGLTWPGVEDNPGGYGPGIDVVGEIPCPS